MNPASTLPAEFRLRMQETLGADFSRFEASIAEPAPVSVRLNPLRDAGLFRNLDPVPWASGAWYLPGRFSFTRDPLFHAGCYYVQEASSMFLEHVFRTIMPSGIPLKVLDLCAAPGGKSTQLLDAMPEGSLLVSNEVIASRNSVLRHNLMKWGRSHAVITQNDAASLGRLNGYFDVILVDAPCSGEGLFRKQPGAADEWSPDVVRHCAARQQRILEDVAPALRDGGWLIYSTCTYEPAENDERMHDLITRSGFVHVPVPHRFRGIRSTRYGLQFYPHEVRGEGFYISVLRNDSQNGTAAPVRKSRIRNTVPPFAVDYLARPESFTYYTKQEELFAFPDDLFDDVILLLEKLYVKQAGLRMGSLMKKELVPSHALALSVSRSREIASTELGLQDALTYLKCGIPSSLQIPRGWRLATYQGQSLGWMKGLGNRVNNYYPKEYRILME